MRKHMDKNSESILDIIVDRVVQRRFEMPVIMILETIKPLAGSISLLGEALVPMLSPLLGIEKGQLQALLEDREIIPRLIEKLESIQTRGEGLGC